MIDPASLRAHYRAFLREGRVLLTGHSHQAWPDVARAAQLEAFDDACDNSMALALPRFDNRAAFATGALSITSRSSRLPPVGDQRQTSRAGGMLRRIAM